MIAGFILLKIPPKGINMLYGYRTKNSMKSQERWDFAQKFAANEMIKSGSLLLLSSLLGFLLNMDYLTATGVGLVLILVAAAYFIWRTEKYINKKFGKD